MHPYKHAAATPDKVAVIDADSGAVMTYAELDIRSNQVAHFFRAQGLGQGERVAFLVDNTPDYFPLAWGAQRAGLLFVCLSTKLTAPEIDFILGDSAARLLIASASLAPVAANLSAEVARFSLGGELYDFVPLEPLLHEQPVNPIEDESAGNAMLYSSGTTGRPKGVKHAALPDSAIDQVTPLAMLAIGYFGLGAHSVYLSTAPLYHAAPLGWTMTVHKLGGTVVLMRRFDPEAALQYIEEYRCNAGQFVPTHFVRMLKLPEEVRRKYDVSTMQVAIHAAAPCPVPVKQAMIDWWGPVIDEYYAGTESNGFTAIKSADWLTHPGSVGKAIGEATLHICNEDGDELPPCTEGLVYFQGPRAFEYHNDPAKTAESRNKHGMTTLGDVGWVDEEGYLYLTDRKSFMIISGGVNIYPQEIENHLVTHPKVADVAVVGAPCDEMGEQVVAVVQPAKDAGDADALADELRAYCRQALSGVKTPKRFEFMAELPRHDTGKLYKRLIRDKFWGKASRIV